jgi:hypothetical protein
MHSEGGNKTPRRGRVFVSLSPILRCGKLMLIFFSNSHHQRIDNDIESFIMSTKGDNHWIINK